MVDARTATGVQIGEGNTQIIYNYGRFTWSDTGGVPPLADVRGVVDSPYRGLNVFQERDVAYFFGREQVTGQLMTRLSSQAAAGGLLMVSGVSGAGKSSVLRAGILPRLRWAGLDGAPHATGWPCLLFTPTRTPLEELAVRTAALAGSDAGALRQALAQDPAGFALTARQAALHAGAAPGLPAPNSPPLGPPVLDTEIPNAPGPPPPAPEAAAQGPASPEVDGQRRLVLLVDQFEQLFTQCTDDGQRAAFITALHAAATVGHGPDQTPAALVVLVVRADFEARCANYPPLAQAVQDRHLLTAMTERQLRLAITEPAKQACSQVEDDLVQTLLREIHTHRPAAPGPPSTAAAGGAGTLPLLSHALDQAWRHRTGQMLTLADYERTGGIEGAVADSAQRVYDRLIPAQQDLTRQIFLRLTTTGSDGTDTADRVPRAALTDGRTPAQVREVEAVLEAFAAERLLTLAADTVEISHEVLLHAWPLLGEQWLAQTHADRLVHTRLRAAAAEWAPTRDPSYLYTGSLLETAAQRLADPAFPLPLASEERDFLAASTRADQRRTHRRRALAALITVSLLTGVIGFATRGLDLSAILSTLEPTSLNETSVKVGVKPYPGFYEIIDGRQTGFEASARKRILNYAGVQKSTPTEIGENNWASQLTEGYIDLAMGMISDRDTRANDVRFAGSYLRTDIGLLTLANADELTSTSELSGKTICTVEETSADAEMRNLQKIYPSILSFNGTSPAECIEKVKIGHADAYSTDRLILMGFSTQQGNIDSRTGKSYFRVHDLTFGREQHISIVLNKKDSQACQILVKAISRYVNSHEWLADLRREVIDEYLRMAPGDHQMTDDEVRRRFRPAYIDDERCTDPPLANTSN
ncbi:nSTAND1 domain-containing NTPase [Nonomuraea sp. ZG12]|uniref:nSTAND1 domain-containing NTPase n=1 Tax=Nonomuraea sp. ZG12 TaxID=3452207 RepID=UPI003F8CDC67